MPRGLPAPVVDCDAACGLSTSNTRQVNKLLPKIGKLVGTPSGGATVIVGHQMKGTVSVRYDDDQVLELPLADVVRNQPSRN